MHTWPRGHHLHGVCDNPTGTCEYIVRQHQDFEPEGEVPEFTIAVKWQEGDENADPWNKPSKQHGWRYVMRWMEGGEQKHITGYGFATEGAARNEAELKATKIVRAQQPEKVYKFKPNLED